jgi:hypothetical protein
MKEAEQSNHLEQVQSTVKQITKALVDAETEYHNKLSTVEDLVQFYQGTGVLCRSVADVESAIAAQRQQTEDSWYSFVEENVPCFSRAVRISGVDPLDGKALRSSIFAHVTPRPHNDMHEPEILGKVFNLACESELPTTTNCGFCTLARMKHRSAPRKKASG